MPFKAPSDHWMLPSEKGKIFQGDFSDPRFQGPVKHRAWAGFNKDQNLTCIQHVRSQQCGDFCMSKGRLFILRWPPTGCPHHISFGSGAGWRLRLGKRASRSNTWSSGLTGRMWPWNPLGAPEGDMRERDRHKLIEWLIDWLLQLTLY